MTGGPSTSVDLGELASVADETIDLAGAALAIVREEYAGIDLSHCVERLAALVEDARADAGGEPAEQLEALHEAMFVRWRFRGNDADYYDPRNSYLNDVLERRLGIPISLAVIYLHAGERLGLVLEPVSFPTHFLVRSATPGAEAVIDVFRGGRRIATEDMLEMLLPVAGSDAAARELLPRALAPVPRREVVARMLRNLKGIYLQREDWERALRITDRLVSVSPEAFGELRDRGHLYARIGATHAAHADYARYLESCPDAPDAANVRALCARLGGSPSRLN